MKHLNILMILLVLAACGTTGTEPEQKEPGGTVEQARQPAQPETPWSYETDNDEMTGDARYFASTVSTNKLEFDFPYEGGTTGVLIVRNMDGRNELIVSIDNGQFMPSFAGEEYLRVKFDDKEVKQYTYSSSSGGGSELIFVDNKDLFLQELQKADRLMIEAPFYDEGRQVFYFEVNELDWEH